ncbi:unnamed protein product [Microthlaspi erraticum]|uniref:Uncharacterized protein n=1 Tax=Microthlaspi erraticum TaxID=1685480 RepID=A0A6D2JV64_9BRAS|nr:unnamed protein product [Microthlaspi erraticum]
MKSLIRYWKKKSSLTTFSLYLQTEIVSYSTQISIFPSPSNQGPFSLQLPRRAWLSDSVIFRDTFLEMETLIVAAEHRNQYYGKRSLAHDRFRSAPSKTFRQINCRTFQSGVGLLPRPKRTSSSPLTKGALPQAQAQSQSPRSPKSVLPVFNLPSSPIPIGSGKSSQIRRCASEFVDKRRSLSYSELWAGPTYSNSPPATSVPIPKFSLKQKRTISLSFPAPESGDDDIRGVAKSAPVSPTSSGPDDNPFHCTVSATLTLRRMLNLETAEE